MSEEEDAVAELRSTVEELEATVRGLTEELVEANERLRQLEAGAEDEAAETSGETSSSSRARVEEVKSPESKKDDNDTDESTSGDDIIVA